MFCPWCGTQLAEASRSCESCGREVPPSAPAYDVKKDMKFLLPVNTSGWAIAAGYAGLFSITIMLAPLALLLGVGALVHLNRRPGLFGKGRAWFATIAGGLFTLLLVTILVVR
ncbi:MAG TPA: zinc ribbon domain-containing protein [Phycisphaerales bacterium]|nr:zinc ribbon domain-containing protein [Phycisphaerales bacterium]